MIFKWSNLPIAISVLALVFAALSYWKDLPSNQFERLQDDQMKKVASHAYTVLINYATILAYRDNVETRHKKNPNDSISKVWDTLGKAMHQDLHKESDILSEDISGAIGLSLLEDMIGENSTSLADFYSFKATLGNIPTSLVNLSTDETIGDATILITFHDGIYRIVCYLAMDRRNLFRDQRQIERLNKIFLKHEIAFSLYSNHSRSEMRSKCEDTNFSVM